MVEVLRDRTSAMGQGEVKPDVDAIRAAVKLLVSPGDVAELRHMAAGWKGRTEIRSGYFDDPAKLVAAATTCSGGSVYITLNPVQQSLLSRRVNRIDAAGTGGTTADQHIDRRRWLLIDCDPVRASGISSTHEEKARAKERMRKVAAWLGKQGWSRSVEADSGNGYHLLIPIDLPNDEASNSLVQRLLIALSNLFTDEQVTIDTSVYNASRITKLYGTVARKGDHTPDRPHRVSRLVSVPDKLVVVTGEQLAQVAGPEPEEAPRDAYRGQYNGTPFDLGQWIDAHLEVRSHGDYTNSNGAVYRWKLESCPLCGESDGSAVVLQFRDGRCGYRCHHNRCTAKGWSDLREFFEPGYRDKRGKRGTQHKGDKPTKKREPVKADPYKPFPVDAFPGPLNAFLKAEAKAVNVDPSMVALPLLAGLASAIGNSRTIVVDDWFEPAILWTCVVAESGDGKSPAADNVLEYLHEADDLAEVGNGQRKKDFAVEQAQFKVDKGEWEKRRRKGDCSSPPKEPAPPVIEQYTVDIVSLEKLALVLSDNPRGVLLTTDELAAFFGSLGQYKSDSKAAARDRASWLKIWSARPWRHDFKVAASARVRRPHCSITGGVQPALLRVLLGQDDVVSGLAARFLWACPPRRVRKYSNAKVLPELREALEQVYRRQFSLAPDQGTEDDYEQTKPRPVELSPEARELFLEFHDELAEVRLNEEDAECAATSKMAAQVLRIALVFHCVEDSSAQVSVQTMQRAVTLGRWFHQEAKRLYRYRDETDRDRELRRLAEWVAQQGGEVTPRDVERNISRIVDAQEAEEELRDLGHAGYGELHVKRPGPKGGRPTTVFSLNPASLPTQPRKTRDLGGCVGDGGDCDSEIEDDWEVA